MDNIYNKETMDAVLDTCRSADKDRLENTPKAAELREQYCRNRLMGQGYDRGAIEDMFVTAMGQILHEDIERALSGE